MRVIHLFFTIVRGDTQDFFRVEGWRSVLKTVTDNECLSYLYFRTSLFHDKLYFWASVGRRICDLGNFSRKYLKCVDTAWYFIPNEQILLNAVLFLPRWRNLLSLWSTNVSGSHISLSGVNSHPILTFVFFNIIFVDLIGPSATGRCRSTMHAHSILLLLTAHTGTLHKVQLSVVLFVGDWLFTYCRANCARLLYCKTALHFNRMCIRRSPRWSSSGEPQYLHSGSPEFEFT